jgi:hypothetical protein
MAIKKQDMVNKLVQIREHLIDSNNRIEKEISDFLREIDKMSPSSIEEALKQERSHEEPAVPATLPVIRFKGSDKTYYFDQRLSQVRNITDPNDFVDLRNWSDSVETIEYWLGRGVHEMPFKIEGN